MITRREILKSALLTAASITAGVYASRDAQAADPAPAAPPAAGPFVLPPLTYDYDALEPYIDATTMKIHHDKHHAAYVANLNKAVAGYPDLQAKSAEDLLKDLKAVPEPIRAAVRNNAGGHANHTLFWETLSKYGGAAPPAGALRDAMLVRFGSFENFQAAFTKEALGVFGSGWVWLTMGPGGMDLEPLPNQDSPLSHGRTPLMGIDVWEHAYYLKHQNKRVDYVAAFYNVINWEAVAARYDAGKTA